MKYLWPWLAPLVFLIPFFAWAAGQGVTLLPSASYAFINCSATGSAAQTVKAGKYVLTVTDETVALCYAGGCADDGGVSGTRFPAGTVMLLALQVDTSISCRSAGATGDVALTKGE